MRAENIWRAIYREQKYQQLKGNNVDLDYSCRYSNCDNKEVIEVYNKREFQTEHICLDCFVEDWGNYDYFVQLNTLYDESYHEPSFFDKYGVKNESKK